MLYKQKITDFCKIYTNQSTSVMFGCPADIVKILQSANLKFPDTIVIPDDFFQFGTYMASLEFPFYHLAFSQEQNKVINVIGNKDALARVKTALSQSVDGPSERDMKAWGIDENSIAKYISYKKYLQGSIQKTEDIFNFIPFTDGTINVNGISIGEMKRNFYKISCGNESAEIDLNIKRPTRSFFLSPKTNKIPSMQSGMIVIGAGNGFSPYEENSCAVVLENGIPIAIDGTQWMRARINEFGYDMSSIPILVLTHIHDDHSNVLDLIISGKKINILTLKIIYKAFVTKAAATLNLPEQTVKQSLNFIEIQPGKTKKLFGIEFLPHETVHPIPCIGIKINKKILISGDGLWGSELEKALKCGIIDKKAFNLLQSIPFDEDAKIIFMDAGGKSIHPEPAELSVIPQKNRKKLILNHISRNTLKPELGLKTALGGQIFPLKKSEDSKSEMLKAISQSPFIKEIGSKWLAAFSEKGLAEQFNCGQRNARSKSMGIILRGTLVNINTGAIFHSGDIISLEEPVFQSISYGNILKIEDSLFEDFLKQENKRKKFSKLMSLHKGVSSVPALWRIDQKFITEYLSDLQIKTLKKEESIKIKKSVIALLEGKIVLKKSSLNKNNTAFIDEETVTCNSDQARIIIIKANAIKNGISNIYLEGFKRSIVY